MGRQRFMDCDEIRFAVNRNSAKRWIRQNNSRGYGGRAINATLRRLARELECRPENLPGTDKAWVLRAMWQRLPFLRELTKAWRVTRR